MTRGSFFVQAQAGSQEPVHRTSPGLETGARLGVGALLGFESRFLNGAHDVAL